MASWLLATLILMANTLCIQTSSVSRGSKPKLNYCPCSISVDMQTLCCPRDPICYPKICETKYAIII